MGKTPKPLIIFIHPMYEGQPWVDGLIAKGHHVLTHVCDEMMQRVDLILAPQACRFVPGMEFLIEEFVKGARRLKYPQEKA